MKNKLDVNKYIDEIEKNVDGLPSTFINVFNSGIIVDVKKLSKIGISILRISAESKKRKGRKKRK